MFISYRGRKNKLINVISVIFSLVSAIYLLSGCAGSVTCPQRITVSQIESLRNLESMLPLEPDSIIARYIQYDTTKFFEIYSKRISYIVKLIDSLNNGCPESLRIDTLAIDRSFGSFGEAACHGKSIFISSSYFILYDDATVLRSIIFHEFGHIAYKMLDKEAKLTIDTIWTDLKRHALLYLFHEAEYSGNARFGGHPEESSEEMFASAFNILNNRPLEFQVKMLYIDQHAIPILRRLTKMFNLATAIF